MTQYDKHIWSLKAHSYGNGNKVGKLLANQLKDKIIEQKMTYIQNPKTGRRVLNPKDIDAFSDYYDSLYNLRNYFDTPQPSEKIISVHTTAYTFSNRHITTKPAIHDTRNRNVNQTYAPQQVSGTW